MTASSTPTAAGESPAIGFVVLIATGAALGGFLFGFDTAVINGAVIAIEHEFGANSFQIGLAVSLALLGSASGAAIAGPIADRIGRVRTMTFAAGLFLVSAIGSGLPFGLADFIMWRILGGVAVGAASVLAAVYDGDPDLRDGDPQASESNNNGTDWDLGENGVLIAGEVHYHRNRDSMTKLPGTFKLGGFWMSGDYADIGSIDTSRTVDGNAMLWVVGEHMLYREQSGEEQGLGSFGTFLYSLDDKANEMDYYFGLGLVYTGLIPGRSRDKTGMAFTKGWFSDELKTPRRDAGLPIKHDEAVLEINHKFEFGRGIAFQPDIQYVINPAGNKEINDAILVGAKLAIEL